MVVYNYSGKEINAKIVYYGPALSGKTTNLEWIYSKIPTEYSGKMVSLRTQADRTIFFDFLPLELGLIDGYKTRFMLYTVPGQVYYNATRKMVLKGVDGLVFVADSQEDRMEANIESLQNLRDNLAELGLDFASMPLALQWNKRDLPNCTVVEQMEAQLNQMGVPTFEASALTGEGVYETLHRICRMIYHKLTLGDHASTSEVEAADDPAASLFGDAIAERLQDLDLPTEAPEPIAIQEGNVSTQAPSVLHTILGDAHGREEAAGAAPASGHVPPTPGSVPPAAPSSPVPPAAAPTHGPAAPSAPVTPPASTPVAPVAAGNDAPGGPAGGEPDGMVEDLVDEVLGQLEEQENTPIEHDTDIFDELAQREESRQVAKHSGLHLITDPRKLSPGSGTIEGGTAPLGPILNAKIIEVPLTLDADTIEEGKTIRIVLNLSIKR